MSRQALTILVIVLLVVIGFLLYRIGVLRSITNLAPTATPQSVSVAPTALPSPTPTQAISSPTSGVTVSPTTTITKSPTSSPTKSGY